MRLIHCIATLLALSFTASASGQASTPAKSGLLDELVATAVRNVQKSFRNAKVDDADVAVTVIDLAKPDDRRVGSWNGGQPIYPASVVKLFYLAAAHRWMEDNKMGDSDELRRTLRDMIVDSSNDATATVVDALSGVGNGEPLADDEMKAWAEKRNAVNRYFTSLGYTGINVCQKTYAEGPYGRERIFLGEKYSNRNKLTTDATARLLADVALGQSVTQGRSRAMMELLRREPTGKGKGRDDQNTGFSAKALPAGSKLWSKAGWTSTARHDAAYVETPDGMKLVIVVFTTGHASTPELLPAIVSAVMEGLSAPR